MLGVIYGNESLGSLYVVVYPSGAFGRCDSVISCLEYQYRYFDPSCMYCCIALGDTESELLIKDPVHHGKRKFHLIVVSLYCFISEDGFKALIRTVCDYTCNIRREFLLLSGKKRSNRTHAPSNDEDLTVVTYLTLYKLDPPHEVDALVDTVCAVLTAAHAVSSLVSYKDMTLDLAHYKLSVCCHLRRMLVPSVKEYDCKPGTPVSRRSEVARQLRLIEGIYPYV